MHSWCLYCWIFHHLYLYTFLSLTRQTFPPFLCVNCFQYQPTLPLCANVRSDWHWEIGKFWLVRLKCLSCIPNSHSVQIFLAVKQAAVIYILLSIMIAILATTFLQFNVLEASLVPSPPPKGGLGTRLARGMKHTQMATKWSSKGSSCTSKSA